MRAHHPPNVCPNITQGFDHRYLTNINTQRRPKCTHVAMGLLLGISAAGTPTIAQAEVHVEGTASAVRVTTDRDALPDVLSAFETPFNLRYHTSIPLDGNVSSVYSGSLKHVISRLLDGYGYVIAHDQGTIDIAVWGRRAEAPAPIQKPVTAASPQAVAGPGRVRDAAVDARVRTLFDHIQKARAATRHTVEK